MKNTNKLLLYFNLIVFLVTIITLLAFCFDLLEGEDQRKITDYSFLIALGLVASVSLYNMTVLSKRE